MGAWTQPLPILLLTTLLGAHASARDEHSTTIPAEAANATTQALVHPVILVPGDGGSQIEARLNKTESVAFWCSKTSDWSVSRLLILRLPVCFLFSCTICCSY